MRKRLLKFAGSCLRFEGSTVSHSHGRQTLLLRPPCNLYQSPLETDLFFFKFRLRILVNLTCHVPEFGVVGTEFRLFEEAADLCRTYQAVGVRTCGALLTEFTLLFTCALYKRKITMVTALDGTSARHSGLRYPILY